LHTWDANKGGEYIWQKKKKMTKEKDIGPFTSFQ